MKSLFNDKLPIALFTVTALATAANAACERYKDCSFDVKKTADVVYATDVPALSSATFLPLTLYILTTSPSFKLPNLNPP